MASKSTTNTAWFITGTDTEVGKTFTSCALLHAFNSRGFSTIAMKPIAAGTDENNCNEDVTALTSTASIKAPNALITPYLFKQPIAPHIAASANKTEICATDIINAKNQLAEMADILIVEGVGGFAIPLSKSLNSADLPHLLALPVILVVGMRLGCINHALLTQEAIKNRNLTLSGWIANRIDPNMLAFEDNLETLKNLINAPLLGVLPPNSTPSEAAQYLSIETLLNKSSA